MRHALKSIVLLGLVQTLVVSWAVHAESLESAENTVILRPDGTSELRLSGSSTLHDWEARTKSIHGGLVTDLSQRALSRYADTVLNGGSSVSLSNASQMQVNVSVNASELECENPRMHRDLLRAINATEYPYITYELSHIVGDPVRADHGETQELIMLVVGKLSLAGVTRDVSHAVHVQMISPGFIEVTGTLDLNMLDFGITPPSALFGLIRAHPELSVSYRIRTSIISDALAQSEHVLNPTTERRYDRDRIIFSE